MCLKVNVKFKTRKDAREASKKPLIAKKDIVVFKVLEFWNGKALSPYMGFEFQKGFIYTNNKFSFEFTNYGYKDILKKDINFEYIFYHWVISVNKGLHAFQKITVAKPTKSWGSHRDIVKMIIPKGSKYFLGVDGDIVSNKLIWY